MGIRQFLKELEDGFVKRWSINRNPIVKVREVNEEGQEIIRETTNLNYKKYNATPVHSLNDMTSACQWNKLDKTLKPFKTTYGESVICTLGYGGKNKTLTSSECSQYFENLEFAEWSTFDDYIKNVSKIRHLTINSTEYKLSKCSCWWWSKNYKCKHMLAACQRLGYLVFDERARAIPVGANRRRGAPRKLLGALTYQPSEELESDDENTANEAINKHYKPKITKVKKRKAVELSEDSDYDVFDENKVKDAFKSINTNTSTKTILKVQSSKKSKVVVAEEVTSVANVIIPKTKKVKVTKSSKGVTFVPRISSRIKKIV